MLKLNLSPQDDTQFNGPTTVKWQFPVLTVDGQDYDLSEIPDGATLTHLVIREATRSGDDYEVTIILRHRANAPEETRFPEPITVTQNGPVELPPYETVEEVSNDLAE